MEFGMQMRVLRTVQEQTLEDKAAITDIDISTLSLYERGLKVPERHMNAILAGYGFPPVAVREIAFGILEGKIDRPAGVMGMIGELELQEG